MKMLGDKIVIQRGETFTYRKEVVEQDGSPFVLPKLTNPYLLISITSDRYFQGKRISYNYYIDLSTYPQFDEPYPLFFPDNVLPDEIPEGHAADYAVWYLITDSGEREYYYWNNDQFEIYSFAIEKTFNAYDTFKWTDRLYTYEIRIVSGTDMNEALTNMWKTYYGDENVPTDNATLYKDLLKVEPALVKSINFNAPIYTYYSNTIIQAPRIIVVYPNN